jgi:mannose-6-phosphate isomerase-like protein (cupin superfamily)
MSSFDDYNTPIDSAIAAIMTSMATDDNIVVDEPFSTAPSPTALDQAIRKNTAFRRVLFTDATAPSGAAVQIVAMTVDANRDGSIGWEVHPATTQYFAVVAGSGRLLTSRTSNRRVDAVRERIDVGAKWVVTPGTWHDVEPMPGHVLHLLTIYFPPHHPPNTIQMERHAQSIE